MEAPTRPTTCDHCGKAFNTSDQHPRRYCSIACEEGRAPRPIDDPASDGYHLHIKGQPDALVGRTLMTTAVRQTCYSPDWHRDPSDYSMREIVSHDEENEILVYKTTEVIGKVTDMENGNYCVESGSVSKEINPSDVVSMIRKDKWWAE